MFSSSKLLLPSINRAFRQCRALSLESFQQYKATNEPILGYKKGSKERNDLEAALKKYDQITEVPIVIGNEEVFSSDVKYQVSPFDHQKKIAKFSYATKEMIEKAIKVSLKARTDWEKTPLHERAAIFLKAADLVSNKYRPDINATTMLGQGKTIIQAEIDAACELADFYRFDVQFAGEITKYQPLSPESHIKNSMRLRGMEGFWAAVSPFNFTAIGGHLAGAPALMGNAVVWKPSDTATLSNYIAFKILREAGVPAGVINFIPADGPTYGNTITASPDLAGINFTGSVSTFRWLWQAVGNNINIYKSFPRLIGECGGKNFHFVHYTADVETVVNSTIRSGFEYGGQKCSACSRAYIPKSLWPQIKEGLIERQKQIKLGSALEADSFLSAVIDDKSFNRIKSYIDHAKNSPDLEIVAGGKYDDSKGYFVEPTIVLSKTPNDKILNEEIFGPVVTIYVYDDASHKEVYDLIKTTSPFGLTGSVFAKDTSVAEEATEALKQAAGNFYINCQSTGSVVGQQPFGGARLSGTNDKAGGPHYLLKFCSPQSVKEMTTPLREWKYPYMEN